MEQHDLWNAPWRAALLRVLDSPTRKAVAQTCKGTLTWLLSDCPSATLRITLHPGEPAELVRRRAQWAGTHLAQRGKEHTAVLVEQRGAMQPDDPSPSLTLSLLGQSAHSQLTDLRLCLQHMPVAFFSSASPALQRARTLHLSQPHGLAGTVQLPQPASQVLPALRQLVIGLIWHGTQDALFYSIRAYLPQLQSLAVNGQVEPGQIQTAGVRTLITRPADVSHSLQHVTLPALLTPQLARWLQQAAPVLQELTLAGVSEVTEGAADVLPVCSWHTLRLASDAAVPACAWVWLPLPAKGQLSIEATGSPGILPQPNR